MTTAGTPESYEPAIAAHQQGNEAETRSLFPVVGIGASAGGLGAFARLLRHLPASTGMAFILVQNFDPQHENNWYESLVKSTGMPVVEATPGTVVRPNNVYVIPPGRDLSFVQGALQMTQHNQECGPHLPIDRFLLSLAEEPQSAIIGVLLSGAGTDGVLGLCEIKAAGGITFAQDVASAEFPDVPRTAINSGCVDFILAPEAIAQRLTEIGASAFPASAPQRKGVDAGEEAFKKIINMLQTITHVNFGLYRDTTIRRRFLRRMALHSKLSLSEYCQFLTTNRNEVESLFHDLLITVSGFFRDLDAFEALKKDVFPRLLKIKNPTTPWRIWVPGCSSGQEPYSLAMSLVEFYDDQPAPPPIQIFATDISESMLKVGRIGLYPKSIEDEVSPERLRRFFRKEGAYYRIDKSIRNLCIFARQNVTADPPFSHLDLISCRNLLIYLAPPAQKRVLPIFHYALNIPGFLFLGSAESVGNLSYLFEPVNRSHRIYAKKAVHNPGILDLDAGGIQYGLTVATRRHGSPGSGLAADFQREADRILMRRYSPPGVLVNEDYNIVQFRGRTHPYLEFPPGEPTTDLLKMVREGLFVALRKALAGAKEQERPNLCKGTRLHDNGAAREIGVEVIPIKPPGAVERFYLVLFHEAGPESPAPLPPALDTGEYSAPVASTLEERPETKAIASPGDEDPEVMRLRQELAGAKEYLQTLMEQQEAINEELRSANEEILSSNEELKSTNEEMQTSKEELQSTNEELRTVNEQLQHANLELNEANNDLNNLLASTQIPVIMVGRGMRIRRFTESAKKALNLAATDIGLSIRAVSAAVQVPDLEDLVGKVIDEVQPVEQEVRDQSGRWYALRIHPYRTLDHKIDGAVVVLVDIDRLKRTEQELREAEARMRSIVNNVLDGIITMDSCGIIDSFNAAAEKLFGFASTEVVGQNIRMLALDGGSGPDAEGGQSEPGVMVTGWRESVGKRKDGFTFPMELAVSEFHIDARPLFTWIVRDITERKRLERELHQRLAELAEADRRKDEFLATLAHELRNPLTPILNSVQLLRELRNSEGNSQQVYQMLERQVNHLNRLVADLLDVTRITLGTIELRKKSVPLRDIVESAVEMSKPLIDNAQHHLRISLPPEPLILAADPVRLAQVFANLLQNAANYTEQGGSIWLTARRESGDAVVSVRDSGAGIPREMLTRVFGMFVRGENPAGRVQSGLGIGLTLARSLVELHGGSIEAHSDGAGKGSDFIVRLPLATGGACEEPLPERPIGKSLSHHRILVVDDNQDVADSIGMLLEATGVDVRIAYSGFAALETLATFKPSVALLDIGMTGMNGYEVARQIREHPEFRDVTLIALTGWGGKEDICRSQAAGFHYHLVKPVSIHDLQALLDSLDCQA